MNAIAVDIPVLETERLRFRLPSIDDLDAEAAFYQTERAAGVGGKKERRDVFRSLASIIGHWVMRGYGFWAVDEKATGRYCGRVGLWYPLEWPEPEIGWDLFAGATGKGYATEAATAARAIVRDIASGKSAARLMSLMTMIFTVAPVVAPSIGISFFTIQNNENTTNQRFDADNSRDMDISIRGDVVGKNNPYDVIP